MKACLKRLWLHSSTESRVTPNGVQRDDMQHRSYLIMVWGHSVPVDSLCVLPVLIRLTSLKGPERQRNEWQARRKRQRKDILMTGWPLICQSKKSAGMKACRKKYGTVKRTGKWKEDCKEAEADVMVSVHLTITGWRRREGVREKWKIRKKSGTKEETMKNGWTFLSIS